jgi:hypothetical protein
MESVSSLLGTPARVKALKLFLFNSGKPFDLKDISEKTKESEVKVRKELSALEKIRVIKRKPFSKSIVRRVRKKRQVKKVRSNGWILNENFEYLIPLQTFLVTTGDLGPKDIIRKLSRGANLKLVLIAGVFTQDPDSRVDLLVVGDHLKKAVVENSIKSIEAELGREIKFAVFETQDFQYRYSMYDKLVRDILDFPHEKILNKLAI